MPVGEYIHHTQLWSASNHFGSKSFHMPSLCERENEWEREGEGSREGEKMQVISKVYMSLISLQLISSFHTMWP